MISKNARRTLWIAVAACGLALAGCANNSNAGSEAPSKNLKVSFANATEASNLFRSLHTGLDSLVTTKKPDVSVKWYNNNFDPATMLSNANLMVQDKPDAIVNFPVTDVTQGIGRLFTGAKIPCVSLNAPTPGCTFMNIDNGLIGQQVAGMLGAEATKRGWNSSNTTVLIGDYAAAGESVNSTVWEFYKTVASKLGFSAVDSADLTVKTTKIADNAFQFDSTGTTDGSFTAVKNLVPRIPRSNHIMLFTINDDATVGALRALEDAGFGAEDNLLVAGEGGAKDGLKALRDDPRWVAEGVVFVDYWGAYAVAAAQSMIDGGKPTAEVTPLPQIVLEKSTIEQYFPNGATTATTLPPLVDDNKWIAAGGLLQELANVEGLK